MRTQSNGPAQGHGLYQQLTAEADFAAQHSSEPKLKRDRTKKQACQHQEGERKGEEGDGPAWGARAARVPLGRTNIPTDKQPPCSPISCVCTARLFHVNLLIPLQRLQGFCSSTHTTFTFGRSPRLEGAAQKGDWLRNARVPGKRWFAQKLSGSCDTWQLSGKR